MIIMESRIAEICHKAIREHVFPGCVVGFAHGEIARVLAYGRLTYQVDSPPVTANTVYDVASISKSIPTSALLVKMISEHKLSLDDKVTTYIPELKNQYRDSILIRHLLTYTVIFNTGHSLTEIALSQPERLMESIYNAPLLAPPGEKHMYTDAPPMLMGLIIERIYKKPLDQIAQTVFFSPLDMTRTSYNPASIDPAQIAPTEIDWRGEVQALPQDEKAWVLLKQGQIPGHAGLFSSAGDLLIFARMLLNGGELGGRTYIKAAAIEGMHTNQNSSVGPAESLGWQMERPQWMGTFVSNQAFGRTGYPGTSVIIDPIKQTALVHLSNHTYPHRPTERAVAINMVRKELANVAFAG
jgi:CubicO group peptidase (beta-lactamase class C family)